MNNPLIPVKEKQLEDYVKEANYQWLDESYIPSPEAIEFLTFIKLVNGKKGETNKSPPMHLRMIDDLINFNDNLFIVHRGGAKTTVVHEYVFLYVAVYGEFFKWGEHQVLIYVSDTMENGVKNMRSQLEHRWHDSEFLQQYVPHAKFTDDAWEFTNIDGRKTFIKGFAAMTGVRGFKKYGERPTWCGFDDLLSDKNAKSPTILKDIENVIYKAAMEALHPSRRKIVWTGTPFSKADSLYKAAGSGAWNVRAFPLCEKFPCSKEEFKGSWPDRFTYESTMENYTKKLKNGKVSAFNQELMLRITSDEEKLIQEDDIQWYSRNSLIHNQDNYNFYITTDFTTSAKQSADYSVIMVWAVNYKGYYFLVDGICKRQTIDKSIDALFKLAQKYSPKSVGIEASGQQGGFITWIQKEMMDRGIWFNLACEPGTSTPGIRPRTDKLVRFQGVVPWFKAKRMFFPQELRYHDPLLIETEDELNFITGEGYKSAHDDAGDCIAMLGSIEVWRPSAQSGMTQTSSDGIWADEEDDEESALSSYVV